MKLKWVVLGLFCLALCVGLILMVAPAQAREAEPGFPYPQYHKTVAAACSSTVSGDGRQLKIYQPINQPVIYLQCGRVVGKLVSSGCNCRRGGNWRYTTDCQKSAPIYVSLPCPHR